MDLEIEFDRILNIKTNGRDDSNSNYLNFPYEATPYVVLERLANSTYITKKDKIIDYGSGKGRVDFYLAYQVKAKMLGIEYNERLYEAALRNQERFSASKRINFILTDASEYQIPLDITGAYFFNPFSVSILETIIKQIATRNGFKLFFYYPSKSYLDYLNSLKFLKLIEVIDCSDLFSFDERENIHIYQVES